MRKTFRLKGAPSLHNKHWLNVIIKKPHINKKHTDKTEDNVEFLPPDNIKYWNKVVAIDIRHSYINSDGMKWILPFDFSNCPIFALIN